MRQTYSYCGQTRCVICPDLCEGSHRQFGMRACDVHLLGCACATTWGCSTLHFFPLYKYESLQEYMYSWYDVWYEQTGIILEV